MRSFCSQACPLSTRCWQEFLFRLYAQKMARIRQTFVIFSLGLIISVVNADGNINTRPGENVQQYYSPQSPYQQQQPPQQQGLTNRYNYGTLENAGPNQQQYASNDGEQQEAPQEQYRTQPRSNYSPYANTAGEGSDGRYSYPYIAPTIAQNQQPQGVLQQQYSSYQRQKRDIITLTVNDEANPVGDQFYPVQQPTAVVPNVAGESQNVRMPRIAVVSNTTQSSVPTNVLLPTTTENVVLLATSPVAQQSVPLRKEGRALPLWAFSTGNDASVPLQQRTLVTPPEPFYAYRPVYRANDASNNNNSNYYAQFYGIGNQQSQRTQFSQLLQADPRIISIGSSDNSFEQPQPGPPAYAGPEPQETFVLPDNTPPVNIGSQNQQPNNLYSNLYYGGNNPIQNKKQETIFIEEYQAPPSPPTQQQQQQQQNELKQFLEQTFVPPRTNQQPPYYYDESRAPVTIEAVQQTPKQRQAQPQPSEVLAQLQQQLPPPSPEFVNRNPQQEQQPKKGTPPPLPSTIDSRPPPPPAPSEQQQVVIQFPMQQQQQTSYSSAPNQYYVQRPADAPQQQSQVNQQQQQQPYHSTKTIPVAPVNNQRNLIQLQNQVGTSSEIPQQHRQQFYLVPQNNEIESLPTFGQPFQNSAYVPVVADAVPQLYSPSINQQPTQLQYQVVSQNIPQQEPLEPVKNEALPPIEGQESPPQPSRLQLQNRQVGLNPRVLVPPQPVTNFLPPAYVPPVIEVISVNETDACRAFLDAHPMRVNSTTTILSVQQTLLDNPLVHDIPTAQVMICCVHKYTRFGIDKLTLDNDGNLLPCNFVLNSFVEQIRLQKIERLQQQHNAQQYNSGYVTPGAPTNQTQQRQKNANGGQRVELGSGKTLYRIKQSEAIGTPSATTTPPPPTTTTTTIATTTQTISYVPVFVTQTISTSAAPIQLAQAPLVPAVVEQITNPSSSLFSSQPSTTSTTPSTISTTQV